MWYYVTFRIDHSIKIWSINCDIISQNITYCFGNYVAPPVAIYKTNLISHLHRFLHTHANANYCSRPALCACHPVQTFCSAIDDKSRPAGGNCSNPQSTLHKWANKMQLHLYNVMKNEIALIFVHFITFYCLCFLQIVCIFSSACTVHISPPVLVLCMRLAQTFASWQAACEDQQNFWRPRGQPGCSQ